MFRTLTLGISALAILATPIAATAQSNGDQRRDYRDLQNDRRDVQEQREDYNDAVRSGDRSDIRDARDDLRDARDDRRDTRRKYDRRYGNNGNGANWQSYRNYDYNRPARGQTAYYADQYYREGRYYQPRRLSSNDRIYRGRDNRYYCRRSDGTTGLVIGAIGGGVLGGAIASGGSNTLGVLLGGLGGALAGRAIDRNNVTCR